MSVSKVLTALLSDCTDYEMYAILPEVYMISWKSGPCTVILSPSAKSDIVNIIGSFCFEEAIRKESGVIACTNAAEIAKTGDQLCCRRFTMSTFEKTVN